MRILITGGAGCLGSSLLEHWLPRGHSIGVIDNFATGNRELVPATPGLVVVEGTIADARLVEAAFAAVKPDIVVHAAASYKDPGDWQEDAATNVLGSILVAKACAAHGVRRLVNFQTALCYGRTSCVPIPVTQALAPFTSYGITKTAGEQFMMQSGIPTASLRIANVTGPRLAIGPIPTFYKRLKSGQRCFCSTTTRDFLDMEDFLALMDIMAATDAPCGVFHASSGEGHTIREVFEVVRSHLGLPEQDVPSVPPGADDVAEVILDASATRAATGWVARVPFEVAVRRQLAWYDAHGVTAVHSHLAQPTGASR